KYVKSAADMELSWTLDSLKRKSEVLYPGIDFSAIDNSGKKADNRVPVIVWNHRWEHDKNPDEFFDGLAELEENKVEFKLILLGQSFLTWPKCFDKARIRFKKNIVHSGFAESYFKYVSLLQQGDIVVSTSLHEFYGIAIIEALRAGCVPVLPARLSYPELFEKNFLYNEGGFVKCLQHVLLSRDRLDTPEVRRLTDKFSWDTLSGRYEQWLFDIE
ncbi:MAG: glycosyltransferase, partial [Desulfobulbaceae bacterium]|nr:glycosyltransferase [Desulfobulbaceae bacterium]